MTESRRSAFYSLNRRLSRVIVTFFLCFSALACSPSNTPSQPEKEAVYVPSVWAKDFAPGQLKAHYLKHRDEFGDIAIEEYLNNVRVLLNAAPGRDILEKKRDNGDILRYRVSTGEFAVMTGSGRIRTYFKTDYRYWLRQ